MKKVFLTMLFALTFIVLGVCSNKVYGYLYLNNLDFDAKINQDASMDVTEIWNIKIEQTNTLFKTFKTDFSKYSGITNVKVSEIKNGIEQNLEQIDTLMYHVTKNCYYGMKNDKGNYEIAWGVGLDNSSDTRTYKISYTVQDAIKKYIDYAELYWQFVGEDFEINANKITGKITLPMNVENKDEIKVWGHTEDLNGEIYAKNLNTIEFEINNFRSGRYVEIRTLFPTYMISHSSRSSTSSALDYVIKEETKWAEDANLRRKRVENLKKIITLGFVLIDGLICIFFLKKAKERFDKAKAIIPYTKTINIDYYREIPRKNATPSQSIHLLKKRIVPFTAQEIGRIFSATLLDLSLKKYIEFEQIDKKNFNIKLLTKSSEKLEISENLIYEFLKKAMGEDGNITVKELEKYIKKYPSRIEKLKKSIDEETKKEIVNHGLYDIKREEQKVVSPIIQIIATFVSFYVLGFLMEYIQSDILTFGFIVLMITTIIKAIASSKLNKKLQPFTNQGLDESQMWNGLKKYMEDFSMLDKREVPEIVIWEEFLVYATVFGIADKLLKQLKIVYKDIYDSMDINSNSYMYIMIHTDFTSSFTSAISSSVASSYTSTLSSGSGGGGGFSGGGGGGRRPEEAEAGR